MFHKILVAMDYSDRSRKALEQAIQLAKCTSAEVMLLHVHSPAEPDFPSHSYPSTDIGFIDSALYVEVMQRYAQQWQQFEQKHSQILRSFAHEAETPNVRVNCTQLYGDIGRSICQMAEDWQADLILMGRRGRTGLKEAVLGSVSNYVIHHSPCSVLIAQNDVSRSPVKEEQRETVAI
ncbi:MAG: universal stress protein [Oculatellaceae cyanobacterium Prado106]|jgi:nucleotide-binding universal stress UspA family protein|nr:universal stress protein [Oculatellaceae cyanobacterium Prado106]